VVARKDIIRSGDRVRIINPVIVTRVGYPRTLHSYRGEAERIFGPLLSAHMEKRCVEKTLWEICYGLARKDRFGGLQRSLHVEERPELLGQVFTVERTKMVQTGTYRKAWVSRSYEGDYDYDPGGLDGMKAYRLVSGFWISNFTWVSSQNDFPMIQVEHLEKVKMS